MALWLVDDRDGRILAEVLTSKDVQGVLETWAREDDDLPDYLCLVDLRSRQSGIVGTDSSVTIRPPRRP